MAVSVTGRIGGEAYLIIGITQVATSHLLRATRRDHHLDFQQATVGIEEARNLIVARLVYRMRSGSQITHPCVRLGLAPDTNARSMKRIQI